MPADALDAAQTVRAYKGLARVERAFRSLKGVDLEVRPIFHWASPRVRAHVFLCLLAHHLEWHMRQALAPILFDDHDRPAGEARRASPVAKAKPSPACPPYDFGRRAAERKARSKRTDDGLPVHSFRSLLADLACLTTNAVRYGDRHTMQLIATPAPLQARAFEPLAIKPAP